MIRIDDLIKPTDTDHTAAFLKASEYDHIVLSNREYLMNETISIKAGQVWQFNGATVKHTDSSKIMFRADQVDNWAILGWGRLQGTLTAQGSAAETGLQITGCNRYRVEGLTCQLFLGYGIRILPGTYARYKSDQGAFSNCSVYENMVGLQVEADTGAEYNTFTNFKAVGNIKGAVIAAGNTSIIGGSISENTYGLWLNGGSNNGHGIISAANINHNAYENLRCTDVTNGFTFADCHFYNNGSGSSTISFLGTTADVCIDGGVVDSPVVNSSTGSNRIQNAKRYSQFSVGGTNAAGLVQVNNH